MDMRITKQVFFNGDRESSELAEVEAELVIGTWLISPDASSHA